MIAQTIELQGKQYVVVEREEYDRLKTLAKAGDLPPLPQPDEDGNYPAIEYARASLARKIIRDRVEVGLNQREIADLAGIRVETLCRIETGKYSPSISTIEKIDRAIAKARREQGAKLKRRKA